MLVQKAKEGSVPAAREVLDRLLGRPEPLDFLERLEQIEAHIRAAVARGVITSYSIHYTKLYEPPRAR